MYHKKTGSNNKMENGHRKETLKGGMVGENIEKHFIVVKALGIEFFFVCFLLLIRIKC